MYEILNSFSGEENTEELRSITHDILPLQKEDYEIINVKGNPSCFKALVKCKLKNKSQIDVFIDNYAKKNNETLRIVNKATITLDRPFEMLFTAT